MSANSSQPVPEATRAAGLARLQAFVPHSGRAYATQRNFDRGAGAHSGVSLLSPYLRHRLLREDEVTTAVLSRYSLSTAEKFIQEVFWRSYFKGWLERRPSIWQAYRREVDTQIARLDADDSLRGAYDRAVKGETGIGCFDAWAAELIETGYLHNHARMWFASIWIFTLDLPWALGADFFLRHLLDGDPASNTLGWRWVGGRHTRGKAYAARASNIAKFTENRFDPSGQINETAIAPDEPAFPAPLPVPESGHPVAGERTGLLITEDDLHPESLLPDNLEIVAVATLQATAERSPLFVAEHVHAFTHAAIADAARRNAVKDHAATTIEPGEAGDALVNWAQGHGITQIVTPYTPVGPGQEALDAAEPSLKAAGISLVRQLRPYDQACWPFCTAGFFKVKKAIPDLIEILALRPERQPTLPLGASTE